MSKQKVLLLGATGETGGSILEGLLEHGNFDVEALIRPSSAEKPSSKKLAERGIKLRICDIAGPLEDVVSLVSLYDVVISAIDAFSQKAQLSLATACKQGGVKRFVPCAFTTVIPPGDIMQQRDDKEVVYQHIRKLWLPYTVIDVGYWYQFSFPTVPSGRVDYLARTATNIHGDGNAPNLLTDLRDIGPFVARIISDERTLNKFVYTWGDVLTENEVFAQMEEVSGEKIERTYVSTEESLAALAEKRQLHDAEPQNPVYYVIRSLEEYQYSKYIRRDNQPAYAKYLGYLDARELYPDFKPRSFREFLVELLDGKIPLTYAKNTSLDSLFNSAK